MCGRRRRAQRIGKLAGEQKKTREDEKNHREIVIDGDREKKRRDWGMAG